jgi:hypothetical protein
MLCISLGKHLTGQAGFTPVKYALLLSIGNLTEHAGCFGFFVHHFPDESDETQSVSGRS